MSEKFRLLVPVLLTLALAAVAGCKGGGAPGIDLGLDAGSGTGSSGSGGTGSGGAGSGNTSGPIGTASPETLSLSFVTSFATLEPQAALIRSSARFLAQTATWRMTAGSPLLFSNSLAAIRAEYAHAAGLTGQGQTVAVIDAGFLPSHEVFAGKTVTLSGTPGVDNHGTGVASIIAGNSARITGVAPGASLLLGGWNSTAIMATATQKALAMGAVAQNNSWGYTNIAPSAAGMATVFNGSSGQAYLSALDAYAKSGVVLFALSNTRTATSSNIMEALPAVRPSLESGWLAVGNAVPVFDNAGISSATLLSSGCLQAARWCLVADGAWTSASAASATSYQFGTGSSFATPQVAGALALLAEAFPTLKPHDLRLRLLASANNTFFTPDAALQIVPGFSHGYSTLYGHGFLDLRAALLPIGPTTLAVGGGQVVQLGAPVITTGAALGDAVAQSLASVNVGVTDSLSAGFTLPAAALVAGAQPAPLSATLMSAALGSDLATTRLAANRTATASLGAVPGRSIDLATGDGTYRAAIVVPDADGNAGLTLTRSISDGATTVDLGLRLAQDAGSSIGFGSTGTEPATAGLIALQLGLRHEDTGGGFISVGGEMGLADLGQPAMLQNVSDATFNSVSVEIGQRNALAAGDRLSLGLSMPMAVTSGSARIVLPVAMAAGATAMQDVGLDLAPGDRQMDLALSYQTPLGDGRELMLRLVHAENYGNRAGQTDDAAVLAYTFRF